MAFIDGQLPHIPMDLRTALGRIASSYLRQSVTGADARAAFQSLAGCTDPIDRLCTIVEIGDEPICPGGEEVDQQGGAVNRRKMKMWSAYEDNRLMGGIYRFGLNNWAPISRFVGNGRTRAQCAQRWARGLNPRISKDVWTPSEDMRLIHLVQSYGDKAWTKISGSMGNRSDVQCRYHYHQLTKDMAQLVQMGVAPANGFPSIGHDGGATVIPIRPMFSGRARFSMPQISCHARHGLVHLCESSEVDRAMDVLPPPALKVTKPLTTSFRRGSHILIPPVVNVLQASLMSGEGVRDSGAAGDGMDVRPIVPDFGSIVHLLNRERE
jgi:hypothetical protein